MARTVFIKAEEVAQELEISKALEQIYGVQQMRGN